MIERDRMGGREEGWEAERVREIVWESEGEREQISINKLKSNVGIGFGARSEMSDVGELSCRTNSKYRRFVSLQSALSCKLFKYKSKTNLFHVDYLDYVQI